LVGFLKLSTEDSTMTYLTGAVRSHNYAGDKFVDRGPLYDAPLLETARQWFQCVKLADEGNALAQKIVAYGTAINARKIANAERVAVPAWAQAILSPIEEDDETENLDEALAALAAL
jgi:hypothetical protein